MIRFASIASGSSGNCSVVISGQTTVLIDAGITCKRIREGFDKLGADPDSISAVFITHEHSDHIQGLKVMLKKTPVPVFGSRRTMIELIAREHVPRELAHVIDPYESTRVGDIAVRAFPTFHDAVCPVWYRLDSAEGSVAVVTDTGHTVPDMVAPLSSLDAILIEANHDVNMLEAGPYTFSLKRRVMGMNGHLSNEACGKFLCGILSDDLKAIALGHLSKENNYPDLAVLTVKNEIDFSSSSYVASDFNIFVAKRDNVTKILWE